MKKLLLLFFLLHNVIISHGQSPEDTTGGKPIETTGDDPSQFITRAELFNEIQHHTNNGTDFYLNQTTLRTVVKIGKKFTTRLDVPFVYNSFSSATDYRQFGLSDISFRLLGYKFHQSRKAALIASVEFSLNTAKSPLIGAGKNIIVPLVSYTRVLNKKGTLLAFVFQDAISFSGDDKRERVHFTKFQPIILYKWTRKVWTVFAPELFIDYVHGNTSMNMEGRFTYSPVKQINVWAQAGYGIFGDFIGRYRWSAEVGCRYFLLSDKILKRKN